MEIAFETLKSLRAANVARNIEWMAGASVESLPIAFRCIELIGEVGEAANVMKKLTRESLGLVGSRATLDDLADELADVVICADLIAMDLKLDLSEAALYGICKPHTLYLDYLGVDLGRSLARVCGMVEVLGADDRRGLPRLALPKRRLAGALEVVILCVHKIAVMTGIDLSAAIARKFNATSRTLGFLTRLAVADLSTI